MPKDKENQKAVVENISTLEELMKYFLCDENCDGLACEICEGNSSFLIRELFYDDEIDQEVELSQWTQDIYQLKVKTEIKMLGECIDFFVTSMKDFQHHIFIKKTQIALFHRLSCL